MRSNQKVYLIFKRLIGIFGSVIGIIFCFFLFWWWICLINIFITKGHSTFVHERIGKDGKPFKIVKFRTMKNDVDPNLTSYEIDKGEATTKFGQFLRKTSLDETIQLVNIFVGHMAFIGPRPLIDKDEDHITIELRKENGSIHLRPGISGLAQINGRTGISPEEKAKYDEYYYKHFSLWFDIKLFFATIFKSQISQKGS